MTRINLDTSKVPAKSQETLSQIHAAFGLTPNMFAAVANSPVALQSMWSFFGTLGGGRLNKKLAEKIAVAIANRNQCEYCLAAHTALGKAAGVSAEDMAAAQVGQSADLQTQAALAFALTVVANRAQVSDADFTLLRNADFDDGQIAELMSHIALNVFTNYINIAFDVPVDFPKISLVR